MGSGSPGSVGRLVNMAVGSRRKPVQVEGGANRVSTATARCSPPQPEGAGRSSGTSSGIAASRQIPSFQYTRAVPDEPLAYFLTFRCNGTWLPGDSRGYFSIGSQY